MHAERAGGINVNAGTIDFGGGVAGRGAIRARKGSGAKVGDIGWEDDMGAGGLDGIVPLVAGDVPVELIMIVEETEGVGDDVLDGNSAGGVVGIGNKDFEFAVLAFAAGFKFQWATLFVTDGFHVEKEAVVHAAGTSVFDGNIAINAVPGAADKFAGDIFSDINLAIGGDDDVRIKSS